jgi:hypothetical protein
MKTDPVDKILAQWQRERPDLDVSPMGFIGRMTRLAKHLTDKPSNFFGIWVNSWRIRYVGYFAPIWSALSAFTSRDV